MFSRYNEVMAQDRKIWIKICGITTAEDAESAMNCGADALGFVFFQKSPRAVDADKLRSILESGRNDADRVALFVNPTREEVEKVLDLLSDGRPVGQETAEADGTAKVLRQQGGVCCQSLCECFCIYIYI